MLHGSPIAGVLLFSAMQKTKLLRQFNMLETSRKKLTDDLKKLDPALLQYKPAPDKWSVSEVLNHLQFSEQASIAYATKKILGGKSFVIRSDDIAECAVRFAGVAALEAPRQPTRCSVLASV